MGDELTLDYTASSLISVGLVGSNSLCLCGADSCIGTLRLPPAFVPSSRLLFSSDTNIPSSLSNPLVESPVATAESPRMSGSGEPEARLTNEVAIGDRPAPLDQLMLDQLVAAAAVLILGQGSGWPAGAGSLMSGRRGRQHSMFSQLTASRRREVASIGTVADAEATGGSFEDNQ
ncbi:unnamed protein product [Protopolystoma xenopodis]|uniref:Post-SET domain-containing protein n=1 Tax=Protopolystoma xenopodis TaxID=117903 RepID=A0A3S5C2X4_9PLAT|nr:unnamed protein product [Protopolystoma xenopodis]